MLCLTFGCTNAIHADDNIQQLIDRYDQDSWLNVCQLKPIDPSEFIVVAVLDSKVHIRFGTTERYTMFSDVERFSVFVNLLKDYHNKEIDPNAPHAYIKFREYKEVYSVYDDEYYVDGVSVGYNNIFDQTYGIYVVDGQVDEQKIRLITFSDSLKSYATNITGKEIKFAKCLSDALEVQSVLIKRHIEQTEGYL